MSPKANILQSLSVLIGFAKISRKPSLFPSFSRRKRGESEGLSFRRGLHLKPPSRSPLNLAKALPSFERSLILLTPACSLFFCPSVVRFPANENNHCSKTSNVTAETDCVRESQPSRAAMPSLCGTPNCFSSLQNLCSFSTSENAKRTIGAP